MFQKLTIGFATLALTIASAAPTYKINLPQASMLNGTELKAGDYKVEINNDKAHIWAGKVSTEAPVKVENGEQKFPATSVRYGSDAKVQAIHVGGTKMTLVFEN